MKTDPTEHGLRPLAWVEDPPKWRRAAEEQEMREAAYKARIALALERYAEWRRKKGLK